MVTCGAQVFLMLLSYVVFACNKSYQMNPANYREALVEAHEDESEGADILLVSIAFFGVFYLEAALPIILNLLDLLNRSNQVFHIWTL